jgi:hypothetical protein
MILTPPPPHSILTPKVLNLTTELDSELSKITQQHGSHVFIEVRVLNLPG